MSTTLNAISIPSDIDRCSKLRQLLNVAATEGNLPPAEQLALRLNALDELDAIIGDLDQDVPDTSPLPQLIARAKALSSQFEAANEVLFQTARAEITARGSSPAMESWLMKLTDAGDLRPGLSFDLLDEIISGVLQLRRPREAILSRSAEMTPYQPTPARHILDLIAICKFAKEDVLVDLGSGLGHVPLLVSILTGISTVGVEIQPDHAASAQETAERLNLSRVQFEPEDARNTDLSTGTVFYMFTPFRGSILADVLSRLQQQSNERQIRICSLGPCSCMLQNQSWLRTATKLETGRIRVFESIS